jgi:tRNA(Ile2) C34 agmatinyltransferase TiaS
VTPAVLDRPASPFGERAAVDGPAAAAGRVSGGRVTLEERLNAALHAVRTNGSTDCPVCRARMTPSGAGGAADGAECGGCGSRVS